MGPKFGKKVNEIRTALASLDGNAAMAELNDTGKLTLDLNGEKVELEREDLLIDTAQAEGFETQSWGGTTVVLDKTLTPELVEEGFIREIESKVQTMRKEAGFDVVDRIRIYAEGNEKIEKILSANEAVIKSDILCDDIVTGKSGGYAKEWNVNGEDVKLGVEKIS